MTQFGLGLPGQHVLLSLSKPFIPNLIWEVADIAIASPPDFFRLLTHE